MSYKFDAANHIHTLDDKPLIGTTTALDVVAKPLTWWAAGMACSKLGWVNPKQNGKEVVYATASKRFSEIKAMSDAQYVALLNEAYRAHNEKKEKAADEGVDLHARLEEYIRGVMAGDYMEPLIPDAQIQPFIDWATQNVKRFIWCEINCYSRILWVGGISDFGYEDMNSKVVIGDFKSSPKAYFTNFIQAGGYDIQITENGGFTPDGEKVFTLPRAIDYYAIFPFGGGFKAPTLEMDTKRFQRAFSSALDLYRSRSYFEEKQ